MIEPILNHFNFCTTHRIKFPALWDILTNQTVIRPCKVGDVSQNSINRLMHRKLTTVVTGDDCHHVLDGINNAIMAALTTRAVLLATSLNSVNPDLRSTKVTIAPL